MRYFGYSTGAISKGDVEAALGCLRGLGAEAVEFSALRLGELGPVLRELERQDCTQFKYCSFHAPSRFAAHEESEIVAGLLSIVEQRNWPIVVHPDTIHRWDLWRPFGSMLLIENMDQRKACGRTADELDAVFTELPEASLCYDLGHLRQIDPTMVEAYRIVQRYGSRIRQIHLSDVDSSSKHHPLNIPALKVFMRVVPLLGRRAHVILESPATCAEVPDQLMMAMLLFAAGDAHRWMAAQQRVVAHQQAVSFARDAGLSVNGVPLRLKEQDADPKLLRLLSNISSTQEREEPDSWRYFRRAFFSAAGLEGSALGESRGSDRSATPFESEV